MRHGQCESNVEGFIQGQIDSPLTPEGEKQAEAIADRLAPEPVSAIYASDLQRTRRTAEPIAERHGLPLRLDALVRECHLGVAQGMTAEEFQQAYPDECRLWRLDPVINRPPGAERFEEVIARCGRFLSNIQALHKPDDAVAVVGHIGSISGLICAAFDLPVRVYLGIHVANASLSILETSPTPKLRLLNDTCHLIERQR